MNMKKLLGLMLALFGMEFALALEQPEYVVVAEYDEWEVRHYKPYIAAMTRVTGSFEKVGNQAFKRLGGYIFGDNARDEKIAMTAPVAQGRSSETGDYWVTFMMPSEYDMAALPDPADGRVEMVQVPARHLAVVKYRGGWSQKKYRQHEQRLRDALAAQADWQIAGEAVWARYNPPFVPPFFRHNEVMIPVTRVQP